jgi:uncharacterized protein YecT (DUF1311 family)
MPTDDPKGDATPGPFVGFQTYADDTPRDFEAEPRGDWRAPERRSWAVAPAVGPAASYEAHPEPRRRALWPMMATGAAVLAAFGGGFLLARTDPSPPAAPRPVSEAAALAAAQPMNVEVAAVAPIPAPKVAGAAKLEVLPRSTPPTAFTPRPLPPVPREAPTLAIAPAAPAPREVAEAPVARDAVAVAPAPRASFDCRDAPTRARAMVCRDAGLAAMDRRMKQAYAAAVASGASRDDLEADQEDWLNVREDAATYSRRAVADIYRQRIDELDAIAGRR